MPNKNVVTLKKLAKELGISISTVSRALSNHPDISSETKARVKETAKRLHYIPNLFAKGFRTHKTFIIGLIVPDISHYFTSTLIKGIMQEAELNGYKVIVSESRNNELKQTEMLQTMNQFGVDGVLLSLARTTKNFDEIINTLQLRPLVLVDKVSTKVPCTQIVIDDEDAAFRIVEHLIQTGKKRIAIIKETEKSFNSEMRYLGYIRALKTYKIEIDKSLILSSEDISMEQGKRLGTLLISMKNRPDGIFCITDSAAIGVIKALNHNKIPIPNEIAVAGFSNNKASVIIQPKLTTIDQPGKKIGEVAVKYLLEEINNDIKVSNKTIEIKTNLIVRDSTFKSNYT
ncbi:LacI family DNA-binding transcriptional regulator [Urechidicola croceus]|uniref:LacI family transcriptional regulator n=1 Tax=Urechidicola croceus TaxID=1850246 RepID=A0A1D8P5D3_9FLAO|nr:LacI family DNA-binding transcriptional regulator [Urechidicola croceus]AOW19766.1 LacI family transcriptional regulator [Urechidicola croceus]